MSLALAEPDVVVDKTIDTEDGLRLDPTCESVLDGRYPCSGPGFALVRYKAHACRRDGKGIVLCKPCLDWIAAGGVECSECNEAELYIVSTVKL